MADAYEACRAGGLEEFYEPLVVDDAALERGRRGAATLAIDTRLRDALRALGFGAGAGATRSGRFGRRDVGRGELPRESARSRSRTSALALGARIDGLGSDARRAARARRRSPALAALGGSRAVTQRLASASSRSFRRARAAVVLVRARARRLLARGARLADGEGPRHLGLPRVLPPARSTRSRRSPSSSSSGRRSRRSSSASRSISAASVLLEVVFGLLYAISVVAWSATALTSAACPRSSRRCSCSSIPAWATLYHQASSDAVFATGLALWALLLARTLDRPSTWRFVAVGAGIARARPHPAREPGAAAARARRAARRVRRLAAAARAGRPRASRPRSLLARRRGRCTTASATTTRPSRVAAARGCRSCASSLADKTISPENGEASRRLARADRAARCSRRTRTRASTSPLDAYLANGSNYETVRLIALSDAVLGRDENYDVLFDSALEAIREHPGTYVRGVADTFWEFLRQQPLREDVAPREQTAPERACADLRERTASCSRTRRRTSSSTACRTASSGARPTTSTRARSPIPSLVWDDPAQQERYREIVSQVRAWDAELPVARGRARRHRDPEPHHAALPAPAALARGRARRARSGGARAAGGRSSCSGLRRVLVLLDPRGLAGRRARVRAAALPAVHRDGARRARR